MIDVFCTDDLGPTHTKPTSDILVLDAYKLFRHIRDNVYVPNHNHWYLIV